jgi:hypothetical protein
MTERLRDAQARERMQRRPRRERHRNSLGSARETGACLDAAIALGYVEEVDAVLLDALDRVRATLAKSVMLGDRGKGR